MATTRPARFDTKLGHATKHVDATLVIQALRNRDAEVLTIVRTVTSNNVLGYEISFYLSMGAR